MVIELYKNLSSNNTINKDLIMLSSFLINLRGDFNVRNPVLRLGFNSDYEINELNYIKMPLFGYGYFVDRVEYTNSKFFTIYCSIDVLESYKTEIMACKASVMRGIKTGDNLNFSVDELVNPETTLYTSNAGFDDSKTLILSTLVGE